MFHKEERTNRHRGDLADRYRVAEMENNAQAAPRPDAQNVQNEAPPAEELDFLKTIDQGNLTDRVTALQQRGLEVAILADLQSTGVGHCLVAREAAIDSLAEKCYVAGDDDDTHHFETAIEMNLDRTLVVVDIANGVHDARSEQPMIPKDLGEAGSLVRYLIFKLMINLPYLVASPDAEALHIKRAEAVIKLLKTTFPTLKRLVMEIHYNIHLPDCTHHTKEWKLTEDPWLVIRQRARRFGKEVDNFIRSTKDYWPGRRIVRAACTIYCAAGNHEHDAVSRAFRWEGKVLSDGFPVMQSMNFIAEAFEEMLKIDGDGDQEEEA